MTNAVMYRLPVSKVVQSEPWKEQVLGGDWIEDKGVATVAKRSEGNYIFSEKGIGTRSLALLGKWNEVCAFLGQRSESKIINMIPDLPDIYMKVGYAHYEKRFSGLFPQMDAVAHIIDHVGNIFGPTPPTLAGIAEGQIMGKKLKSKVSGNKEMKLTKNEVAVHFTYLPQGGYQKIGTIEVGFAKVLPLVAAKLRDL